MKTKSAYLNHDLDGASEQYSTQLGDARHWDQIVSTGRHQTLPLDSLADFRIAHDADFSTADSTDQPAKHDHSLRMNPIIVAKTPSGKHYVLDGTHRFNQHIRDGAKHINAFVMNAPEPGENQFKDAANVHSNIKKSASIGHGLSGAGAVGSAALVKNKPITNKKIAHHWMTMAYGEAHPDEVKSYTEHLSDQGHKHWEKTKLPVSDIEGHHSGHDASDSYIKDFSEQRSKGSEFPAIIAKPHPSKPGKWQTIDGQHRTKAAQSLGQTHIDAYIPVTSSLKKARAILEKGVNGDWKQDSKYRFKHHEFSGDRGQSIRIYHGKTRIGHLAFSSSPDKDGYHRVFNSNVHESHRGKGLYQEMIRQAGEKASARGSKGVKSEGYQRSRDADRVWDKVATHAMPHTSNAQIANKLSVKDSDYYLDATIKKAEEILEKMSRPAITFPHFSKLTTRPDQQVQVIENDRQKKLFGQKVANAEMKDQKIDAGKRIRLAGSSKVHANKDEAQKALGQKVAGRFDRSTLGMNYPADNGPKAGAIAGKLRSKYEDGDEQHDTKTAAWAEKKKAAIADHRAKYDTWYKRAYELSNEKDKPGGYDAYRAHVANKPIRPRMPRRPSKKLKETSDLNAEQIKSRGLSVDSTIHHEGLHYTMAEMENHYGRDVARKVESKIMGHYDPDALAEVGSFIHRRLGYKTKSPKFHEEILAHSRDLLVNPAKRKKFKEYIGTDKFDKVIKALKQGHQKAYEYAKNLKPVHVLNPPNAMTPEMKKAIDELEEIEALVKYETDN